MRYTGEYKVYNRYTGELLQHSAYGFATVKELKSYAHMIIATEKKDVYCHYIYTSKSGGVHFRKCFWLNGLIKDVNSENTKEMKIFRSAMGL